MSDSDSTNDDLTLTVSSVSYSECIPGQNNIQQKNNVNGQEKALNDQNLKRIVSIGNFSQESKPEGKILVLYTGGTIGMVRNSEGALVPLANAFVKNLRRYPNLHDAEYAEKRFGAMGPLVIPKTDNDNRRIIYHVEEYSPLLDSSNMRMDDWSRIARDIQESYEHFDGFVVLHGTDTLSYTASALSFMLEALGKIVILTGSQLPLFDTRSDGLDNFLTSLVIAANYNIPEVCIFFGTNLMRGNRTTKASVSSFEAFHSPNAPPLATCGIDVDVDYRSIFRTSNLEKFHVHANLNEKVGLLRLFPSITADLVKAFLKKPIEGVVLQTYGAGNVPSNREDIIAAFKEATDRGVILVNITQCPAGSVSSIYDTGVILVEAGVVSGFDMTPEAALSKLSYVLSKTEWDLKKKREMIETNLRGELTDGRSVTLQDWDLCDALGRSLRISSPAEFKKLSTTLFPAMMTQAVIEKDMEKIESLKGYGADISQQDADGRTPLHIACCEGDVTVVQYLLEMGANVHIKDRFNRTPFTDALENDRHEVIKLMLQCGAHVHECGYFIGEKLCAAAAANNVKRLESYHIAGVNMSQVDPCGRTALHVAALLGHAKIVSFLLKRGANPEVRDLRGQKAVEIAKMDCKRLFKGELSTADGSRTSLKNAGKTLSR